MVAQDVFAEWDAYAKRRKLIERDIDLEPIITTSERMIVALTGIRRSGKSSILMLLRRRLEEKGLHAAYVNVEDSRLRGADVLDSALKWFGDEGFLILDEVTSAQDWEGWLARNHEILKGRLRLIVSSSRRSLQQPAKPLRGRVREFEVYPLSFREFLRFREVVIEPTTAGQGRLEAAFDEYLVYGGFPEVALTKEKTEKVILLNGYFRDIVGLDVADAAGAEPALVDALGRFMLEAPLFSASRAYNWVKTLGFRVGKERILEVEKAAENGYLFMFTSVNSASVRDRKQYPRRCYGGDTGFRYAVTGRIDYGALCENAVMLELRRRLESGESIHYWKSGSGTEIDFLLTRGPDVKVRIQVTYEVADDRTLKRELKPLLISGEEHRGSRSILLTGKPGSVIKASDERVEIIPLIRWLMEAR